MNTKLDLNEFRTELVCIHNTLEATLRRLAVAEQDATEALIRTRLILERLTHHIDGSVSPTSEQS